nr:hypothetical protein [uncultured Trichococcus sp.]
MRTEYTEKPDRILNFGWWLAFLDTGIIPGEERFAGYYPANEDLFPGEGGFTGNYQPNEVGITGEDFLAGNSRP